MKRTVAIALLGLSLGLFGCNNTRLGILKPSGQTAPNAATPTPAQLVSYLNNNAERIQSLRFEDMDLTCTQGLQSFGLRGKMVLQKPRNFRMSGDAFGKQEVDIGSNDQEFWFWIARDNPSYQWFCSYKDLSDGQVKHMPLPFQPDWIIETLGLGQYGPAEKYQLEADQDTLKLVERTRSPQGYPVRKVIVFRRREVFPPQAQVTQYLLIDEASNQEICSAHILDTQMERGSKGVVPRRIELRMPSQKLKLAMKLDGMSANLALPAPAFVRQPLQGIPSVNMATGKQDSGVQPVQAQGFGPPNLPQPK